MSRIAYLDTSAIVKRYVVERGSDTVAKLYSRALNGDVTLSFSAWNIGEVLGVLNKYHRRGWLEDRDYDLTRAQFIGETLRLLKLRILRIVPVKTRIIIDSWRLLEKHHVYVADALQIASARYVGAETLYTADRVLHEASFKEGVKSILLE